MASVLLVFACMLFGGNSAIAQTSHNAPFGLLGDDGTIQHTQPEPVSGSGDASVSGNGGSSGDTTAASQNKGSAQTNSSARTFRIQSAIASDLLDPGVAADVQKDIDGWISRLNTIEVAIQRGGLSPDQLKGLESRVLEVDREAERFLRAVQPMLKSVDERLSGLEDVASGDKQAAKIPETESLIRQRESLQAVQKFLNSFIKQAEVVKIQAYDLSARVATQRRKVFIDSLLVRTYSVADPALWKEALEEIPTVDNSARLLLRDWYSLVRQKVGGPLSIAVMAAFLIALLSIWPMRRRLLKHTDRHQEVVDPSPLRRSSAALVMVLAATFVPALFWYAFYTIINLLNVAPPRVEGAINAMFLTGTFAAFSLGLITAVTAPSLPAWRMIPVSDQTALKLYRHSVIIIPLYSAFILISGLLNVLFAKDGLKLVVGSAMTVIAALMLMRGLRIIATDQEEDEEAVEELQSGILAIWGWIAPLFWIGSVFSIGAVLAGYIWFGWFVAAQMVWIVIVFSFTHLLLQFTDDAMSDLFRYGTRVTRALRSAMGFRSQTSEQIGVILSGLLRLLIILFALFSLIVPWGFTSGDLTGMFRPVLNAVHLGSLRFSLASLLGALIVFAAILGLTRISKRWLEDRFLPKTRMDIGLRSSISIGFGYIGFIIATLLALAYAGLNLQNIAIVAGALSVGIGLGLQGIVNNFVSGLIMLAERPIKVGDWVVVGADQGYVRRINVRATEIETFERSTVIVPNSNLISGVVKNWMHGSSLGRIIVPVRVTFGTDPELVRDILYAAARTHPKITSYPPPDVFFMAFGENGLNFELRVYLPDINDFLIVASDLHFEVFKRLREANIEIPLPQRDLHLRSGFDDKADRPRVEAVEIDDLPKPKA
ncbi:DUF3772 domain-containing protein [Roseibium sp. RKSG952]|uniref:DUF3772 domain-containing protein n=1 Tax=Roseibium sp. RKSG952 TaxID=2529384 RepID=UPI0018AD175E|nr:DUF3772 domain-containing protein [Roseibium sp. RKSG952]